MVLLNFYDEKWLYLAVILIAEWSIHQDDDNSLLFEEFRSINRQFVSFQFVLSRNSPTNCIGE